MAKQMRALRILKAGAFPEVVDVPIPEPGPGQVRLRVAGSGLCHSDLLVIHADPSFFPLPLTLGHEPSGWIDAVGPGVTGPRPGDAYAVYFPWGCGHCTHCVRGEENICQKQLAGPGAGRDGGMADYLIVDDVRHLVPLGELDPVVAAPLMCAGLTSYHAINTSLPKLRPGDAVVLIGIGGLGHIAIQILRTLSSAVVIAVDTSPDKLRHAEQLGAQAALLSGPETIDQIRKLTGGIGAHLVLDMVGNDATLDLGAAVLARKGELKIVGVGGGTLPISFFKMPREASVVVPYAGTLPDLFDVVRLARDGRILPHVEKVGFADLPRAYERMEHGQIRGRAVLVPNL